MHRIDTDSAAPGNLFTDGNPAIGQQGTVFDSAWLNDIQENVAQAIEHANIALVKGDTTQLWKAIAAIAQGVLGVGGDGAGAVPTTRQVLGGGLVTGGGPLDGDRTLTVTAASADDLKAGLAGDKAATPSGLAALAGGLSADDQIIFPGGRILKFGGLTAPAVEGLVQVNFPTPFPNACQRVVPVALNTNGNGARDVFIQLVSKSKAGFVGLYNLAPSAQSVNSIDGLDYIAIGY